MKSVDYTVPILLSFQDLNTACLNTSMTLVILCQKLLQNNNEKACKYPKTSL